MNGPAPRSYVSCGLRIRSEVELDLPAWAGDEWDVDIRWGDDITDSRLPPPGDVIATYESDGTAWYIATETTDGYRLRFVDCGEFVISADLCEMVVRADPAGQAELLPILLAGTAIAFMLTLRGATVLHASAVAVDDHVLAFVGQSGRGKTTLAALLCVDGAELVTDDVLSVEPGPPVSCVGGAGALRLRSSAASIAELRPDLATRTTADERLALAPASARLEPLPLAAIVIPWPSRTASSVQIERVDPAGAVVALLSFPRVHGWRRPDVLGRDFTAFGRIANAVPLYNVTIPWGPPFGADVAGNLAALVRR